MIIAQTVEEVRAQVRAWKKEGLTVGLVPTMGYLHEGHASLITKAVSLCDRVVASVFVNPVQFSPNEDLARSDVRAGFQHVDCARALKRGPVRQNAPHSL